MSNEVAPAGQVWVCLACGKRSKDQYGDQAISLGWDESCMIHAQLCYEDKLIFKNDRVVKIEKDGLVSLPIKPRPTYQEIVDGWKNYLESQ